MKSALWIGIVGALITGAMIGVQATLTNRSGQIIGPFRTGLYTNIAGGVFALLLLTGAGLARSGVWAAVPRSAVWLMSAAGLVVVFIVIGVPFSLRYTGVMAGLGTIIMGQMLVSAVVDAVGWGSPQRIPFTWERALGLLLMAAAIYFLLPKK